MEILDGVTLWCQYSASGDPTTRHASYGRQRGHQHYFDHNIRPCVEYANYELSQPLTVLAHLPFGRTRNPMALNEYQIARRLGFGNDYREFVSAYSPAINRGDMNFIPYLGNFDHIRVNDYRSNNRWFELAMDNFRPVLDAGCSHCCIDAQSYHLRTEQSVELFDAAEDIGLNMMVEATPHIGSQYFSHEAVVLDTTWVRRHNPTVIQSETEVLVMEEAEGEEAETEAARTYPQIGDEEWYKHDPIVLIRANWQAAPAWIEYVRFNGCTPAVPIAVYKRLMR